jgi:hypothetical protein
MEEPSASIFKVLKAADPNPDYTASHPITQESSSEAVPVSKHHTIPSYWG